MKRYFLIVSLFFVVCAISIAQDNRNVVLWDFENSLQGWLGEDSFVSALSVTSADQQGVEKDINGKRIGSSCLKVNVNGSSGWNQSIIVNYGPFPVNLVKNLESISLCITAPPTLLKGLTYLEVWPVISSNKSNGKFYKLGKLRLTPGQRRYTVSVDSNRIPDNVDDISVFYLVVNSDDSTNLHGFLYFDNITGTLK